MASKKGHPSRGCYRAESNAFLSGILFFKMVGAMLPTFSLSPLLPSTGFTVQRRCNKPVLHFLSYRLPAYGAFTSFKAILLLRLRLSCIISFIFINNVPS